MAIILKRQLKKQIQEKIVWFILDPQKITYANNAFLKTKFILSDN